MPRLMRSPSALTAMVSVTKRSPLRCTAMSLTKQVIFSAAWAGASAAVNRTRAMAMRLNLVTASGSRQADDGDGGGRRIGLEKVFLAVAQHMGDHDVGERLDADVEVAHRA